MTGKARRSGARKPDNEPIAKGVAPPADTLTGRSTTIGFTVLAALVGFVAVWMTVQGRQALQQDVQTVSPLTVELNGFRSDLYQLPDEPLLGFVEIPAGEFLMGSNPAVDRQAYENERWSAAVRQGTVELPRYFLGRYEVTVAQYRVFSEDTGHPAVTATLAGEPDHPVSNITWTDALAYSRWLQRRLLESESTPDALRELLGAGWQITVPTEAQWEKGARGSDGDIYPWGNRLLEGRANFGSAQTRPVGSLECPECNYDLADMSGNVWELTRSPYQSYPYTETDDRDNLEQDALWVMRGGSFADGPANIRGAVRGGVDPGVRNATIGFRLALSRS